MDTLQESDEPSSTEGGILSLRHRPVHSKGKTLTPVANGFQRTIYTKKESGIPFVYTYYQRVILRSEHFWEAKRPNNSNLLTLKGIQREKVNGTTQVALNRTMWTTAGSYEHCSTASRKQKVSWVSSAAARHRLFPSGVKTSRIENDKFEATDIKPGKRQEKHNGEWRGLIQYPTITQLEGASRRHLIQQPPRGKPTLQSSSP